MKKIFVDTETCGFHGPIVLIQYAIEDGPIIVHDVWLKPYRETLDLMEMITQNCVIGFNLAFDWFHFCQMYTTLQVYAKKYPLMTMIDAEYYANCEEEARDLGCLKPASAFDIMLHARKTEYQTLMDRNDIYIKAIPYQIAPMVADELNKRLPFKPVYFEKQVRKDMPVWRIRDSKNRPGFQDIYVAFKPSSKLKALAKDALNLAYEPDSVGDMFEEWEQPLELGYAPFAKAIGRLTEWKGKNAKSFNASWNGAWPCVIDIHITRWMLDQKARQYAERDIEYTRALYKFFGEPPVGDNDSILACMVGAVRWKGYKIDIDKIKELRDVAIRIMSDTPRSASESMEWLSKSLDETERLGLPDSTNKVALQSIVDWDEAVAESIKEIDKQKLGPWERFEKLSNLPWTIEASRRAFLILEARHAKKEIENYDKLLLAGRFHVSRKVIGTLTNRSAGDNQLNAQGIKKAKYVRACFPLAYDDMALCGGDFAGFEITIADAVYDDPKLRQLLQSYTTCCACHGSGKGKGDVVCKECEGTGKERVKIHAVFGTCIFPGHTYESIRATAGQVPDLYTIAKSGLFTWLFAGTEHSFQERLGVPREQAFNGLRTFERSFPNVGAKRQQAMDDYVAIEQPDGPGSKIVYRDHPLTVETLQGFARRFDLEYEIIEGLCKLAENPPESWEGVEGRVTRNRREQTVAGAARSALYSAAFTTQGRIQRAAINTPIQGTGAMVTKDTECDIWALQPVGYNDWVVIPMNVHDEIMCPTRKDMVGVLQETVERSVNKNRKLVPLLEMEWKSNMATWASK